MQFKLSLTYSYIANPSIDSMLAQYFLLYQDVEKFWKIYPHVGILARIVALSRPLYQSPATKKGKCTPCISGGTISRSSLESRIRFLPSSMLAIPALWSPPGIAVAGTPDTPPANVPIPVTFVGIVAVCVFSYRFVPYLLLFFFYHFHTFVWFFRFHGFFFFFRHFYTCTQISGFYSRMHSFPCVDHIRFRFGMIPETFPNRDVFRFSCVSIFIHILLYRCGGRNGGGTYSFPYFRHMRAVASVDRAYYLRWFLLFALVQFFFFFFRVSAIFRRR